MTHAIHQLHHLGQSIWYDNITRDMLHSGELERLIRDDGLRGMTSNPTIFEKAVGASGDYDQDIATMARMGEPPEAIVEALMVKDVKAACDLFRPLFDQDGHGDGTVSIEVPPSVATDTNATIAVAERLWKLVDRPNVMIKIPGTDAGIPAISHCLAAGINVNITLLFAIDRYKTVIDAFMEGLERRVRASLPVDRIHSVASFFVSRVDTQTDAAIAKTGERGKALLHQIAIANARVAYQVFGNSLLTPRWQALAAKGAKAQRPLWASTSTKDPSLADTYYVDALVAPDTVNTVPPETFKAYREHGKPEVRITPASEKAAERLLHDYDQLGGATLNDATRVLEEEGVKKFSDSWNALVKRVEEKAGGGDRR